MTALNREKKRALWLTGLLLPLLLLSPSHLKGGEQEKGKKKLSVTETEEKLTTAVGKERIGLLLWLAKGCFTNNPRKALESAREARELAIKAGDKKNEVHAIFFIGVAHYHIGDDGGALENYRKALRGYKQLGDKSSVASTLNNLGVLYRRFLDFPRALECYLQSLKISEDSGDTARIPSNQLNVGLVYMAQKNYTESSAYFQQALEGYKAAGNKFGIAVTLDAIALNDIYLGRYSRALKLQRRSLKIAQELNNKRLIARSLNNTAFAYEESKNHPETYRYLLEALKVNEEIGNKAEIAQITLGLGLACTRLGKFKGASAYLDRGLRMCKELEYKDGLLYFYECRSQWHEAQGQYKEALDYYRKYKQLQDEQFTEKSSADMARMRMQYEVDKKENQNRLLAKDKEILGERVRRQNFIILAVALGLGLVLLLAAATIRGNRLLAKQKERLRDRNQALLRLGRFKEEMTTMLVHDMKNPLNAVMNYTDPHTGDAPPQVVEPGRVMSDMVINILDVQKFEEDRMLLDIHAHLPRDTAARAVEEVRFMAREKNISINNHIPPDLAADIDEDIIKRVFVNLLTNGISYTPNNGTIDIHARPGSPTDGEIGETNDTGETNTPITVSVSDTGVGIPETELSAVFQRYRQVPGGGTRTKGSTGIGLTYCKLAVENHGGHIDVESVVGKGATFRFTLKPAAEAPGTPRAAATETTEPKPDEAELSWARKQVLKPILKELSDPLLFGSSRVLDLLDDIKAREGSALHHWKKDMKQALYACNRERYEELLQKASTKRKKVGR